VFLSHESNLEYNHVLYDVAKPADVENTWTVEHKTAVAALLFHTFIT